MKNRPKLEQLSWGVLLISSTALYFVATDFFAFPAKLKFPFLLCLLSLVGITGLFSFLPNNKGKHFSFAVNCFFIVCMIVGLAYLPFFESKVKSIFKNTEKAESVINLYSLVDNSKTSLDEYSDSIFIVQQALDLDNQNYAIDEIKKVLGQENIRLMYTQDVVSSAKALYEKQGDILLLNEAYADLLEDIEGFETFVDTTKIIYSVVREIESEAEELTPERTNITDTPFTVYIAGCDTRSGRLTIYGRTDVNLILSVNPNTKQILIVGIPRDAYIPNPALGYGNDKLTHLGNDGIYNTVNGVSKYLGISIDYYGEVIFDTFRKIIDAVDGIDIDNPYAFSSGRHENNVEFYFDEGLIHLNGEQALVYVRTRKTLSDGDYGRNEHQTIVLKAFIKKVLSPEIIKYYSKLFNALENQFMTDIDVEDLFRLANMQLNEGGDWEIITYHLGGIGDMMGTASMGWDRKLYVVRLFDSQVDFVKKQIDLMKNDLKIKQEVLPQNDDTTYIPN